jgi:hypothetical protein
LATLLTATPSSLYAQQQQQENPLANSRYILFIHTGGAPENSDVGLIPEILSVLLRNGYSVRKPDDQRDEVGGPGVDYFDEKDQDKAKELANLVNSVLPASLKRLDARRQRVKNPPGYFGVWLF